MTIRCYNGIIYISLDYNSKLIDAYDTQLGYKREVGHYKINDNAIKTRLKWIGYDMVEHKRYRLLKPFTSEQVYKKIIKSLIIQLGGVL